jgi:BirA family biotin operon repressor/biotin-[acetyl-CoA-carboxylase] ligase
VNIEGLRQTLAGLPLGKLIYFPVVGSTNSEAIRMLEEGLPHLCLLVADQQTAGRGRLDRTWYSPPGAGLYFSLVLHAAQIAASSSSRLTGLGALAVCDALQAGYGLSAQIKWPNDVLVEGSKLAGVLVEAQWHGDQIQSAVLGIGINVAQESVPSQGVLDFPATSVETAYGKAVNRWLLLEKVLEALMTRLPQLDQDELIQAWEANLVYRGDQVQIIQEGSEPITGRLLGLSRDGLLELELRHGENILIRSGDIKLREVDRP